MAWLLNFIFLELKHNKGKKMKKIAIVLIGSLVSLSTFADDYSNLCPGEAGHYFINDKVRNIRDGGFVSNQAFVSEGSSIFIAKTAAVCGGSNISDSAKIYGNAIIRNAKISGSAEINGSAIVENDAEVTDGAKITDNARLSGSVRVSGKRSFVGGSAKIYNTSADNLAEVTDEARVTGNAEISGNASISGRARVMDQAKIWGDTTVDGNAIIRGYARLNSGSYSSGTLNPAKPQDEINAENNAANAAAKQAARANFNSLVAQTNQLTSKIVLAEGGIMNSSFSSLGNCRFSLKWKTNNYEDRKVDHVNIVLNLNQEISTELNAGTFLRYSQPTAEVFDYVRNDGTKADYNQAVIRFYDETSASQFRYNISQLKNSCGHI